MFQPKTYGRIKPFKPEPDTCSNLYNCCDCGGENCGCAYCFSCHACEACLSDDENARCELLGDDPLDNSK